MRWTLAKLKVLRAHAGETLHQLAARTNHTPSEVDRALWALLGRSEADALETLMHRRPNLEWNEEQIEHLKALARQGHSNRSTAKLMGTTPGAVSGKMRRLGLRSNSPGSVRTEHARAQAQKAKENGAPAGPGQGNYNGHRPQAKFVKLEADYMALRAAGIDHEPASRRLDLTASAAEKFRTYWRAATITPSLACALPLFARHEDHISLVMAEGGYPRLSERRGPNGHVAVCLPLMRAA